MDVELNHYKSGASVKITFIENPGMAFGFNPGSDFKLWVSIFSLIASIGLFIYLFIVRNKSLSLRIALAMILGGAAGNLIDRAFYGIIYKYAPLFYGKVVDFFDFDFFNFAIFGRNYDRWPIFNVADASVTIGVLILVLFYKQHKKDDEDLAENVEVSGNSEVKVGSDLSVEEGDINQLDRDDETDNGKEIQV